MKYCIRNYFHCSGTGSSKCRNPGLLGWLIFGEWSNSVFMIITITTQDLSLCTPGLANDEMSVNFGPVQQRSNDCDSLWPAQQIRYSSRSELTAQERDAQARDLRLEDSSNEEHFLKRLIEVIHQRWLNEH